MITLEKAKLILLSQRPNGTEILGSTEEGNLYLFIAPNPDPLEGRFDPFFSVDKETGYFRDFSPTDYDNSLDILNRLAA